MLYVGVGVGVGIGSGELSVKLQGLMAAAAVAQRDQNQG